MKASRNFENQKVTNCNRQSYMMLSLQLCYISTYTLITYHSGIGIDTPWYYVTEQEVSHHVKQQPLIDAHGVQV